MVQLLFVDCDGFYEQEDEFKFQRAPSRLYSELMFKVKDLVLIQLWRLKDSSYRKTLGDHGSATRVMSVVGLLRCVHPK
jgi:hypothetical protein